MNTSYEGYIQVIKTLTERFGIKFDMEDRFVHTFYEGGVPLFKLLFAVQEDENKNKFNILFASFHLDLTPVDSIVWFSRLKDLYGDIGLTESYYCDDYKESYLGQSAEIIRMYKTEQDVLEKHFGDGYQKKKIAGREKPKRIYSKLENAMDEFKKMRKGDDDEYH